MTVKIPPKRAEAIRGRGRDGRRKPGGCFTIPDRGHMRNSKQEKNKKIYKNTLQNLIYDIRLNGKGNP